MFSLLLVMSALVAVAAVLGLVSMGIAKSITGLINGSESSTLTGNAGVEANPTVLAAQPATLTVRTDGVSGSLTMTNSSHGIITGQRIDLYWAAGQCYNATVGTVSGTTVPFTAVSGGTALPIATTAMKVGIPVSVPFDVIGNNIQAIAAASPVNAYFVFADGGGDLTAEYIAAGTVFQWYTGGAGTNPLAAATSTLVFISHGDVTGPNTGLRAAAVVN